MPKQNPDADAALHKLGQRLREGHANKHKADLEQSVQSVKDMVREEWEREQKAERDKPSASEPAKEPEKSGPEPDKD